MVKWNLLVIIVELSRRDDLESLGFLLIYFIKGNLPWQGFNVNTDKEKHGKIKDKKMAISVGDLCEGCPGNLRFI